MAVADYSYGKMSENAPLTPRRTSRVHVKREPEDGIGQTPSSEPKPKRPYRKRGTLAHEAETTSTPTESEIEEGHEERREKQPTSVDETGAGKASTSTLTPSSPDNTTVLDETAPPAEIAEFDDGGFLRAVRCLFYSSLAVGVYLYALWVVIVSVVWLGGFQSFHGKVLSFGGASLSASVPLYEGLHDVSSKPVKGQVILPAFKIHLFPNTIVDSPPETLTTEEGVQMNMLLLSLFAIQHTLVSRAVSSHTLNKYFGFPVDLERSFYIFTSAALAHATTLFWVPMNDTVWNLVCNCGGAVNFYELLLNFVFFTALLLAFSTTCIRGHFEFFGISAAAGHTAEPAPFAKHSLFARLRHPDHVALIVALFSTAHMTVGRLAFAIGISLFLIVHAILRDQDLLRTYGQEYLEYEQAVPGFCPNCLCCSDSTCLGCQWVAGLQAKLTKSSEGKLKTTRGSPAVRAPSSAATSPEKGNASAAGLFSEDEA